MVGVGKPIILYIKGVEYIDLRFLLIQIKEATGVNGSTATTGRYRSYRREMGVRVHLHLP